MITQSSSQDNRQRIWQVVASIPPGKVASYGQVATMAGLPRGARQVGRVLAALPPDSNLPWFRVINSQGRISFPEGSKGFIEQKSRLQAEGISFGGKSISHKQFGWQP